MLQWGIFTYYFFYKPSDDTVKICYSYNGGNGYVQSGCYSVSRFDCKWRAVMNVYPFYTEALKYFPPIVSPTFKEECPPPILKKGEVE